MPGAAVGKAVFTAEDAEHWAAKGERVILVRRETSPEDVGGMYVAQGNSHGHRREDEHTRPWSLAAGARRRIVGAEKIDIESEAKKMSVNGHVVREGDWITLDGGDGSVYTGEIPLIRPEPPKAYDTLMKWVDKQRKLGVRTNADTPQDARVARQMGAEGIGLCRTEHMFFKDFEHPEKSGERQLAIQEMILAETSDARRKALDKLLPFQRRDFIGIFEAMDGLPVTIRLIDPPLHEFVPHDEAKQKELAAKIGILPEAGTPRGTVARGRPNVGASRMSSGHHLSRNT